MKHRLSLSITQLSLIAVLLALWEYAVSGQPRSAFLFGSPSRIYSAALNDFAHGGLGTDIATTGAETLTGLLAGALCGTIAAMLLWTAPRVAAVVNPLIVVSASVPVIAMAPVLIMWFGTGFLAKAVTAAIGVFFLCLAQSLAGAREAEERFGPYARSIAAKRRFVAKTLILPGAFRWVMTGVNLSIGVALLGAFIGELISSKAGLGHYIMKASSLYDMPRVLLGVALIGLLSLGLTWTINGLHRSLAKRKVENTATEH